MSPLHALYAFLDHVKHSLKVVLDRGKAVTLFIELRKDQPSCIDFFSLRSVRINDFEIFFSETETSKNG